MKKRKPVKKMTYTDAASVKAMLDYRKDGRWVLNSDEGLYVFNKLYPKGTTFWVGRGYISPVEEDAKQ